MDQKAGKIVNLDGANNVYINGPVILNTSNNVPLSNLLPEGKEQLIATGDNTNLEGKTEKPTSDSSLSGISSSSIPLRPSDEPSYQKAVHADGELIHGLVFQLTIPEPPIEYKPPRQASELPVCYRNYEKILLSRTEKRKIHTCQFNHKTITGAINEEDMRWDWEWDRPENLRTQFCRYVNDVFTYCIDVFNAIKFRIYCTFAVGEYTINHGAIAGAAIEEVKRIHEGMARLFTPLSTDYEEKYLHETEEFKESRSRYYRTPYSVRDYLDEGIIFGTTDLEFIGGYGASFHPVACNEYFDTKAVIMYSKVQMPGQPKGFIDKIKRSIEDF